MDDRGVTAVATVPRSLAALSTQALVDAARSRRDGAFGTRSPTPPRCSSPHPTVPRPLRVLHVRDGAASRSPRRTCPLTRFLPSPRLVPKPAATKRCSPWVKVQNRAIRKRGAWLHTHGFSSTVDYLRAMCDLVLTETGLLPHANAGAISADELASLRSVAPSQGMMIESLRPDLAAHRGAPDKTPDRRLATLEAAGRLAIPFTTGILVGIGETEVDRIDALRAIADSHTQHRHVQEAIVQNFLPKPGTAMRAAPACPAEDHLRAIALARLILPLDVHVQAPPNLTDEAGLAGLLDAGIDDWGGVSPVTADHVNPERPWPGVGHAAPCHRRPRLRASRLGSLFIPEFALRPERWLDPATRFPVLDRSDATGLARDDPGAVWPSVIRPPQTSVLERRSCKSAGVRPRGTRAPTRRRSSWCRRGRPHEAPFATCSTRRVPAIASGRTNS